MKDNYDFSKGVKNPYASKLKKGYTVTVHYDFAQRSGEEPAPIEPAAAHDESPRGDPPRQEEAK